MKPATHEDSPVRRACAAGRGAIETIERLAPIQFGIIYRWLGDETKTVYLGQWRGTLDGPLDPASLRRAWQMVVTRHAILRTAFDWQLKTEPLQIVLSDVQADIEVVDLSTLADPALQQARVAALLAEDLARGFDLDRPPLIRLTLLRLGCRRHVLVWTRHHLTCDGWSLAALFGELFTIYGALRADRTPVLPPAIPFADYVSWWYRADRAAAETYWRERLAGFDGDVPQRAPAHGSGAGFRQQLQVIPADRLALLRGACRASRITLNTLVQGAWALVLARHRGQDRVVFGATEAIRMDEADPPGLCLGPQINTLPVTVDTWSATPAREWLRDLQAAAAAGRRHGRISLSEIAACCGAGRGQALFDSVVIFQNYPLQAASLPPSLDLTLSEVEDIGIPDLPINLVVEPGEQLVCRLMHDTATVPAAEARQLLAHLTTGLLALAEAAHAPVSTVNVAPEIRPSPPLLGDHPAEGAGTVLHRIAAAADDAIALVQGETEITYGMLKRRVTALAAGLCRRLGPGQRIGLLCRTSIDSIIGLLAIQWSGGAYVPLDPAMPAPRLAAMLADAGLAAALVDPAADGAILRRVAADLPVLDYAGLAEAPPPDRLRPMPGPDALAYVIFTSGSTGRPKGVAVAHRSLRAIVDARAETFPEPVGGALLTFPLIFDGSVLLLFATIAGGARLVLPDLVPAGPAPAEPALAEPAPVLDPAALCRTIARARVTHTVMVPSLHAAVLGAAAPGELDGLVVCSVAGEPCGADLVRAHYAALPHTALVNEYGPTEATVWASAYRCRADDAESVAPIGFPVRGTAIYLLDEHQRPVLPGRPGEVVIGGRGVALGYVGNAALTAERFLPDPWSREAGSRMYRTGDLAVAREDGALLFLGRRDQQIKLRGYRIEPGEIEAALRAEPGVAEAVVLAQGPAAAPERLIAYVVGRVGDVAPQPLGLQAALAGKLPAYMVPTVMILQALPRLPSGKLDRQALPDPAHQTAAETGPAPAPGEEAALAAVWRAVLRREFIPATADFFELGGTSLLGMRLVAQIRASLGAPIALYDLFRAPTLRALAPVVAQAREQAPAVPAAIPRRERHRVSAVARPGG
jgi:amino acid adenylation domain-containing protein